MPGYGENRGLVEKWYHYLEVIRKAWEEGREEVEFYPEDPSRFRGQLMRALASAEMYVDMYGGRFADIKQVVRLKPRRGKLVVSIMKAIDMVEVKEGETEEERRLVIEATTSPALYRKKLIEEGLVEETDREKYIREKMEQFKDDIRPPRRETEMREAKES